VLTLALGIGANSVVFSVAKTVFYRSLGLESAEQLAWVRWILPQSTGREDLLSWTDLEDLRAGAQSFQALAMFTSYGRNWEHDDQEEELSTLHATASLGEVLRIKPVLGRMLLSEDEEAGAGKVALISYELWQSRFGGDPGVIGQSLRLENANHTVVGVLPAELHFPLERERGTGTGSVVKGGVHAMWAPLRVQDEDRRSRGARMMRVIGRLRPGVTHGYAQAELATLSQRLAKDHPESNRGGHFESIGFREEILGRNQQGIPILVFAVAAVLIVCCVNLANLLLARGTARQREIAVRMALGASRGQIMRSMLTESLLLSLAGGGLGLAMAYLALQAIRTLGASSVPFIREVSIDGWVVMFTTALSVLTALMFGGVPAWRQSGISAADTLRAGVRATGGREIRVWQRTLLTGQIAALVVLLAAAGLLIESFRRLVGQDLGYQPQSVVMMDIRAQGFKTNGDMCRMYRVLRERLAALPGVRAVGTMSSVPLTGKWTFSERPKVLGEAEALPEAARPRVEASFVAFDYFQAMGIPLIEGRFFRDLELDDNGYGKIVLLNESAAARLFPERSAVGGRFTVGSNPDRVLEVIGVVKDTRDVRLEEAPQPRFYWLLAELRW
jgi:putative ABC transport system permease protein